MGITAKDHGAVQINIGDIDSTGVYNGEYQTLALCGEVRKKGYADQAVNRIALKNGILKEKKKPVKK
eukprot:NODE_5347_length_392_cov_1448.685131_g3321_i2.p1 GENE.NODE_5347_length_392_cov_1448.685131_g3321_i2~~NODE_5347_length_392_cov_1448.685131_g3321_i2.p1  ORF type:complete len:75 (-),score=29.69 NODE_5347_length_392_cov_1448.685131_g3321_i2:166-366(-)